MLFNILSPSTGFPVVLLVIYYLQTGCRPPVLSSLQTTNLVHYSTSTSASVVADKLTSGSLRAVVTSCKSSNAETLRGLLVKLLKFLLRIGMASGIVSAFGLHQKCPLWQNEEQVVHSHRRSVRRENVVCFSDRQP